MQRDRSHFAAFTERDSHSMSTRAPSRRACGESACTHRCQRSWAILVVEKAAVLRRVQSSAREQRDAGYSLRKIPSRPDGAALLRRKAATAVQDGFQAAWRTLAVLLKVLGLAAVFTTCEAQTLNCTEESSAARSLVEQQCAVGGSWHFFQITVAGGTASEIYTSIISPSNASCAFQAGTMLCAPQSALPVSYLAMVGHGCVPDELNNNWADPTPRFSKHVTVCKPCAAGSYWVGLKLLRDDMRCDVKIFTPKGSVSGAATTSCSFASRTSVSGGGAACAAGLQRAPLDPIIVTECPLPDGLACLGGVCNEWVWLVLALCVGLVPSVVLAVVVLVYRRKFRKEQDLEEEDLLYGDAAAVPVYDNNDLVVQDLNTANQAREYDSDNEDGENLPDQLPSTFYVNDRYDAN